MRFLIFNFFVVNLLFAFDFDLKPIKLDTNSYYVYGKEEYFSQENGGDIANSAFIITKNSVILIDTGSSFEYGFQLKNAISKITKNKIKYIINTHHHPDHFLGNNAFSNSEIYATKFTSEEINAHGDLYVSNMANLLKDVAYNTRVKKPTQLLRQKQLLLDNYSLEIIYLNGHTKDDIAIYDKKNKILYASDLVFNKRALATPHANISNWIKSLEKLKEFDFKILVPGHGKAVYSKAIIDENIAYLEFLDSRLKEGVKKGLDTYEVLNLEVPLKFRNYSMFKEEFERSIINLYPKYEKANNL